MIQHIDLPLTLIILLIFDLILIRLLNKFIEHILQILFLFINFPQHLLLIILQHLNLLIQHIPKVFQINLFISRLLASFLLRINDLNSLQQLVLHLNDILIVFQVMVFYPIMLGQEIVKLFLKVVFFLQELLIILDKVFVLLV